MGVVGWSKNMSGGGGMEQEHEWGGGMEHGYEWGWWNRAWT